MMDWSDNNMKHALAQQATQYAQPFRQAASNRAQRRAAKKGQN